MLLSSLAWKLILCKLNKSSRIEFKNSFILFFTLGQVFKHDEFWEMSLHEEHAVALGTGKVSV